MGLWTKWHALSILPTQAIFLLAAIGIGLLLRNKSDKIRYIPLQVIAVIILLMEVGKQINAAKEGYDLYALPFHYCSLFLYILPIHSFYKGKYKSYTDAVSFGCLASLLLFMLVAPSVVYSGDNVQNFFGSYGDFHTVAFHNIVCFYFLLSLTLKSYTERKVKRDFIVLAVFLGAYVALATLLSHTLNVNFQNLLKCNLAALENVRVALVGAVGNLVGYTIYTVVIFVGTILFAYLAYYLTTLILSLIAKIRKTEKKA